MNPELRRHAWQELRAHELLITPVVLLMLAATVVAASDSPAKTLCWGAIWMFVLLTIGWGTMRATTSVSDEVRDRTWDFQRMTALPPARIAVGKVFGAPLLQWYAGGWCLLVFVVVAPSLDTFRVPSTVVGLVALAVLLHALGVTSSVLSARSAMGKRSRNAGSVLAMVVLFNALPVAALLGGGRAVSWWGLRMHQETFVAGSAVAFAAWALLWATRAMGRELREPPRYGASVAFAAFFGLWLAGSEASVPARAVAAGLVGAGAAFILAVYAGVVAEPLTRVRLARIRRGSAGVPQWTLDAAAAVALGLGAAAWGALAGAPSRPAWPVSTGSTLVAAVALMAVRDAAFITCFTLSPQLRQPVGRAIFYLVLIDFLLPVVLIVTGNPSLAHVAMPLMAYALPGLEPVLLMAVHAALAVGAAGWRIREVAREGGVTRRAATPPSPPR